MQLLERRMTRSQWQMRVLKGSRQRQMFSCRDNDSEWPGEKEPGARGLSLGLRVLPPSPAVILPVLG